MNTKLSILIVFVLNFCSVCFAQQKSTFVDERDGTSYKIMLIGEIWWMTENLNFKTTAGSWCYNNDTTQCKRYGRLYSSQVALDICPEGWRLPSDEEWQKLIDFFGGNSLAGGRMKNKAAWKDKPKCDSLKYNFSILPSGKGTNDGKFLNIGKGAYFWTNTIENESTIYRFFLSGTCLASRDYNQDTENYSVRCVRNK